MARYQNSHPSNCPLDCKVYVGGLTRDASREELERAFIHYGKIRNLFVARNPPGFAFVEYDDPQDAEDAVRALDGRMVCGVRVRVEISNGKSRHKGPIKRTYNTSRRRSRSYERRDSYSRSRSSSRSKGRENTREKRTERERPEKVSERPERPERVERETKRSKHTTHRTRSRS